LLADEDDPPRCLRAFRLRCSGDPSSIALAAPVCGRSKGDTAKVASTWVGDTSEGLRPSTEPERREGDEKPEGEGKEVTSDCRLFLRSRDSDIGRMLGEAADAAAGSAAGCIAGDATVDPGNSVSIASPLPSTLLWFPLFGGDADTLPAEKRERFNEPEDGGVQEAADC